MRCQEQRAIIAITLLKQIGIKSAEAMSIEDACKMHARMHRASNASNRPQMGAAQLSKFSEKLRRARVTHPGKR